MERRDFIQKTVLSGGALSLGGALSYGATIKNSVPHKFNLKYAPHFGMFKQHAGENLISQINFMADQGFTSLEDNGMLGRSISEQTAISDTMVKRNMTMGVFVVDGGDNWKTSLTTGESVFLDNFIKTCHKSVEVAKRVNAKWMTVVPGYFERKLPIGIQTANVIEALKRGAEIFEPHGLVMVLEPLSDNPDLFLRLPDQSFEICKAVNSPSCKILFDIYHMQRNIGDLIVNMERTWDEIEYIQIGDNPGRKEPTTGEINYHNVLKFIYDKGFTGVLGMEHGNFGSDKAGEQAVIDAYKKVDAFL